MPYKDDLSLTWNEIKAGTKFLVPIVCGLLLLSAVTAVVTNLVCGPPPQQRRHNEQMEQMQKLQDTLDRIEKKL